MVKVCKCKPFVFGLEIHVIISKQPFYLPYFHASGHVIVASFFVPYQLLSAFPPISHLSSLFSWEGILNYCTYNAFTFPCPTTVFSLKPFTVYDNLQRHSDPSNNCNCLYFDTYL